MGQVPIIQQKFLSVVPFRATYENLKFLIIRRISSIFIFTAKPLKLKKILFYDFHFCSTLLLNLSNNNAATIPITKHTIFTIACDRTVKLVNGIIIIVAAITIPTIA